MSILHFMIAFFHQHPCAYLMRTYTTQHNTGTDNEDGDDEGDNESEEKMLRTQTVDDFLTLLEKPKLPQVLAQVRTHCHTCTWTHSHAPTHTGTHSHSYSYHKTTLSMVM